MARNSHPDMQRRHFEWLAATIKELPSECREQVAQHFAAKLGVTNFAFDRERFVKACGVTQ